MVLETLELGSLPAKEKATQSIDEVLRYKVVMRELCGHEPDNCYLHIMRLDEHKFSLAILYDPKDRKATEYAHLCKNAIPEYWPAHKYGQLTIVRRSHGVA
jgi:hypothetical protein